MIDALAPGFVCLMAAGMMGITHTAFAGATKEEILSPQNGCVWFVNGETGNNGNDGGKDTPLKNIDRAIRNAAAGDAIAVAGGRYKGTFGIGAWESDKPLRLYGGFNTTFSERDPMKYPSLFQPDNASAAKSRRAMLKFTGGVDGTVVDGFVFDAGERNSYHASEGKPAGVETGRLLLPPAKASGQNPTVVEPLLSIPSSARGGNVTIENNVFVNGSNFGIQAAVDSGTMRILNNVFVANRMAAIEVYGTSGNKPAEAEIANNTIVFTWSRLEDFQDMGYGIRIMTKLRYNIHHNIVGGNIKGGIDHTRFNKDEWISVSNNTFFVNKTADFTYSPGSNQSLNLSAAEMVDLPIALVSGNKTEIPKSLDVSRAYLDGYLNARYSEETDLDRESPANMWRSMLGMNLTGTIDTSVTMFGNRYPWKDALSMFGAADSVGAARP